MRTGACEPYLEHMSARETPWYLRPRRYTRSEMKAMRAAFGLAVLGAVLMFGWSLVRFPRFGSTQPAPAWLAWLAAVCMATGAAVFLVTLNRADVLTAASEPSGERTSSTHSSVRSTNSVLTFVAAPAALVVVSLVSTESSARWDPVIFAVMMVVILAGSKIAGLLREP